MRKGETEGKSLIDAMEQGDQDGMQSFDKVIESYIREGIVDKEVAIPYATNAGNLLLRLADMPNEVPPPEPQPANESGSMLDMIER